jgi:hypothetical protein
VRPIPALIAAALVALPLAAVPGEGGAPPVAEAARPADAPEILGEVVLLPGSNSASYGADRVIGPKVNMTESTPGTWKGRIRDYDGVLEVNAKRISGASFNLVMDRDGEEWICQGTWDGKRVRIAFGKDSLTVKVDNRFSEMKRVGPDVFATLPVGPALRVKGDAAGAAPLYPQFVLALLAVF